MERHAREYADQVNGEPGVTVQDIEGARFVIFLYTRLVSCYTFSSPDIKIAICTSDSREGTEEFLTKLGLESMVDLVLCGDDKDSISKPNPHNALFICEQLGVCPSKTIMVNVAQKALNYVGHGCFLGW